MGSYHPLQVSDEPLHLCVNKLNLDPDHLFRHLTEVNGKDTRGGYIEGQLEFHDELLNSTFGLKISLVGDQRSGTNKRVHPNLLYMTRFEGKSRKRELEARAPMWRIDLEIKDGEVFWWTESEAEPLYKQQVCSLKCLQESGRRSTLDLKDLHLTVITPLVRTNVNGIRVKDGLSMRKPLFDDDLLEDHEWDEVLRKLDKFYTGKDGKSEMDRICLQFDFHRFDSEGNEELKPMCQPLISNPIINSKSRNLGILELYPDTISAQKACCKYSRTIYLPSKFKLPTCEKQAYPRFVVQFHNEGFILDERVQQPEDVKIFAGQIFVFKTPVQNEESIKQIYLSGGKIFVEAYRPKDKQASTVKFEFEFKVHNDLGNSGMEWCSFCLENPDRIGQTMEQSLKQRLTTSGVAKPGTKRRKKDNLNISMESPNSTIESPTFGNAASPESVVSNEQQQLMDSIDDFTANIDEFLTQDVQDVHLPDVLQDVMAMEDNSLMIGEYNIEPLALECIQRSPSPDHLSLARCLSPSSPPGMNSSSMSTLVKTDISASFGSDLCNVDTDEVILFNQDVPLDSRVEKQSLTFVKSSVVELRGCDSDRNEMQLMPRPLEPKQKRIVPHLPTMKFSSCSTSLGSLISRKEEKDDQPVLTSSLISRINKLTSDSHKDSGDDTDANERQEKITTRSLISRINKITKPEVTTDAASNPNDSAYQSEESILSSTLDPGSVVCLTSKIEEKLEELSETEPELKVLEMTKKFGGAKRKCMQKIKSKISKNEPDNKMDLSKDLSDCIPALIYIMTPFIVVFLAMICNYIWVVQYDSSTDISDEGNVGNYADPSYLVAEE